MILWSLCVPSCAGVGGGRAQWLSGCAPSLPPSPPPRSPKIFQKTKCSICRSALELPSVHFLCSHSFHQHCFESYSESGADCPTCLPENRKVLDMIRAQEHKRDLHDQFQHQVGAGAWPGGAWPGGAWPAAPPPPR